MSLPTTVDPGMSKTLLVIGAGPFGVATANHLKREFKLKHEVILVSPADVAYFPIASVRLTITEDYGSSLRPLKDVVDTGITIVKKTVISFDKEKVTFDDGEKQAFDILVIATGSKWPSPIGSTVEFGDDYKKYFEKQKEKLESSKSIVFIGGGFINVEYVGELIDKYSKEIESGTKKITIIHNSSKLLPDKKFYTSKLRTDVTNFVGSRGVTLILNSTGEQSKTDPNKVILNNDPSTVIDADLVYSSVGIKPSVPQNDFENFVDDAGFIRTKKNLQAEAVPNGNIFVIGDVANFSYKGVLKHKLWVNTIVKNITSYLENANSAVFENVSEFDDSQAIPCAVSLGPNNGYGHVPIPIWGPVMIPSFVITRVKSRSLFSEKFGEFFQD